MPLVCKEIEPDEPRILPAANGKFRGNEYPGVPLPGQQLLPAVNKQPRYGWTPLTELNLCRTSPYTTYVLQGRSGTHLLTEYQFLAYISDSMAQKSEKPRQEDAQKTHFPRPRRSLQPYDSNIITADLSEDDDHDASLPGSGRHSSDADEAVFDDESHHSSPRTSHHSDDDISVLLPESKYEMSGRPHTSSPYTPLKARSPFRNPSSVRAIQMDTTPPYLSSPKSQQRYRLTTPSRNGTPRSVRSYHSTTSKSPVKKAKREFPLVLLHVTLLPIPVSYSPVIMQKVLPHHILENWKLLQEKVTDTVLERGILIPHPRDDYELLEERLLESLELKVPKILQCGHFHRDEDDGPDHNQFSHDDVDSDDDADICDDCGRRVRDGRFGTGSGSKRWNIKVFAANGLMRAGAWVAAWSEMERIDVEIIPWIDEDMKRQLELQKQEEERRIPQQVQGQSQDQRPQATSTMDEARMREIYGDEPQPYIDGSEDEVPEMNETRVSPSPDHHEHQSRPGSPSDGGHTRPESPRNSQYQRQAYAQAIPLEVLLRNYIYLAAQDRRNIVIFFLSVLVLFLALSKPTAVPIKITPPPPGYFPTTASIPNVEIISQLSVPVSSSVSSSHPLLVSVSSFEIRSHPPSGAPIASIPKVPPPKPQTVVASVPQEPPPENETILNPSSKTYSPDPQTSVPINRVE